MLNTVKGISLPIEQWQALINVLPEVEEALGKKGESVTRPQYKAQENKAQADAGDLPKSTSDEDDGDVKEDVREGEME